MADDLINSHLLVGKSKEEVIALLGNPSLDRPDRMDYALGGPLGGTFGPGGDFQNILAIEFDRGGLAERVFRYED